MQTQPAVVAVPFAPPIVAAPPHVDETPSPIAPSWTADLLAFSGSPVGAEGHPFVRRLRHAGLCCALTASYGAAFGVASGGRALLTSGVGVPLAWIAVTLLGVPALGIVLSLADAPIDWDDLADATSRAVARGSLVLAGLAPTLALYTVSVEEARSAAQLGVVGLAAAWLLALSSFVEAIVRRAAGVRAITIAACVGFAVFSTILVARIWCVQLFGGAS